MALMRRQSLVKFDAPLCETIVDTPKPNGAEVLVRIERCGLCHSDLHIQDGYADLGGGKKLDTTRGMVLPFTLGHEIAGVVEEVGPDASKALIGTKRAVFPWIGCGQCRDCANGDENLCVKQRFLGVSIDGGFATHVLVPDAKYLLDYDPLPVNQAATLMCSGVTAYGALKRLVDRPRQRNLLLIGLGGVGMMGLSFAQAMFKQNITVADLNPAARETVITPRIWSSRCIGTVRTLRYPANLAIDFTPAAYIASSSASTSAMFTTVPSRTAREAADPSPGRIGNARFDASMPCALTP